MSDLHAAPKASGAASGEVKLFSDDAGTSDTAHPMKGLHALIKSGTLRADFVLCPGDMTNMASSQALNYVWASLHKIRELMNAKGVWQLSATMTLTLGVMRTTLSRARR